MAKNRQVACRNSATGPGDKPDVMVNNSAELECGAVELPRLRAHPIGFLWHYVRRHPWGHAIVFVSVLVAVRLSLTV